MTLIILNSKSQFQSCMGMVSIESAGGQLSARLRFSLYGIFFFLLQLFQVLRPAFELLAQTRHHVSHLLAHKAVDFGQRPHAVEHRLDQVLGRFVENGKQRNQAQPCERGDPLLQKKAREQPAAAVGTYDTGIRLEHGPC